MQLMGRIACMMGRHKPDRRGARHDGIDWRSSCLKCGVRMTRNLHGWIVDEATH